MLSHPTLCPPALRAWLATCALSLAGCQPPTPVQSEVEFTVTNTGQLGPDMLRHEIFGYLAVPDLRPEQLKVVPPEDGGTRKHKLQFLLKQPLSPVQAEHIAAGLARYAQERQGTAQLVVQAGPAADGFLQTNERKFDLTLHWESAKVEPYLIMRSAGMPSFLAPEPSGERQVACLLSFTPHEKAPQLQGTWAQIRGMPEPPPGSMQALRNAHLYNMPSEIPYELKVKDALLDSTEMAGEWRDNKVMFQVALIKSNVLHLESPNFKPLDMGGDARSKCGSELSTKHPAIAKKLARQALLADVSGFEALRHLPQPAPK